MRGGRITHAQHEEVGEGKRLRAERDDLLRMQRRAKQHGRPGRRLLKGAKDDVGAKHK